MLPQERRDQPFFSGVCPTAREYLERTPFRRGTETLIRKQQEDNKRRRRLSEEEETRLLAVAPPFLRSMIIAALDTGMRQGEMLALRFGDIDEKRQLIVLRGETTKSRKTRVVEVWILPRDKSFSFPP